MENRKFLAWFLPMSIISFGMAVTNLAPVTIILFFRYRSIPLVKRLLILCGANVGIILVSAGIALIQRTVYQDPKFFFSLAPYIEPSGLFTLNMFVHPICISMSMVVSHLAGSMWPIP